MSAFVPAGSGGIPIETVSGSRSTNPAIQNIELTLALTEVTITLPTGCKQFMLRTRAIATIQVGYEIGESSTNYFSIPRHCFYAESDLELTGKSLYVQSPMAGIVLEVLTWT